jgi:tRNA(Ile)-lysidine synthase
MLLQRVRHFACQHALFHADTRVVVALSGGSDSVALAVLLRALDAAGDLQLVGAAHFNHQLRDGAERDETFSAAVARSLGVPFAADRGDVRARARRERRSLEDAARRERYEFFERARRQFGADVVALGHTRDDQAETFLLRLLRGAGPRGLASMYPRHGTIVRPILDCRRLELRGYLDEQNIEYVDDETNADVAIPRNRVRAELIPLLADRFNPAIVDVLAHEAELSRETWAWLEAAAGEFEKGDGSHFDGSGDGFPGDVRRAVPRTVVREMTPVPFSCELDVTRLKAAPPALRRLVLWSKMNEAAGGRHVSFGHVDAVLHLLDSENGGVDVPGHRVERRGSTLVLISRPHDDGGRGAAAEAGSRVNFFEYPLSIPGEVQLPEAGCVVAAELPGAAGDAKAPARSGRGPLAFVRRDLCRGPLAVRNRRPGDRFRPVGLGGRHKKLQDYFVDRKVAQTTRDRVPLVVDESNRIVWVAGYGIDETFRVTDPSQSVLLLRLRQV